MGGRGGSRLHFHDVFTDNSAARRRCGPIIPGEASAAAARESIRCERTPAAVIGRRQGQLCRCFRQVLESKRSGSSSLRRIYAPSTLEFVAHTQWTPEMAKARRKCAAAARRLGPTIGAAAQLEPIRRTGKSAQELACGIFGGHPDNISRCALRLPALSAALPRRPSRLDAILN